MKLPHAANAIVEPEKVRDYLLSPTHPIGRFKAAFFGMLGYSQDNWQELQAELRGIAALEATVEGKFSRFGNKYRVAATLTGPSGRSASIVTVWIVRHGEEIPRLVTALPGDKT